MRFYASILRFAIAVAEIVRKREMKKEALFDDRRTDSSSCSGNCSRRGVAHKAAKAHKDDLADDRMFQERFKK